MFPSLRLILSYSVLFSRFFSTVPNIPITNTMTDQQLTRFLDKVDKCTFLLSIRLALVCSNSEIQYLAPFPLIIYDRVLWPKLNDFILFTCTIGLHGQNAVTWIAHSWLPSLSIHAYSFLFFLDRLATFLCGWLSHLYFYAASISYSPVFYLILPFIWLVLMLLFRTVLKSTSIFLFIFFPTLTCPCWVICHSINSSSKIPTLIFIFLFKFESRISL